MNISIRKMRKSDAAQLVLNADNKKVWDNLRDYFPHPYSIEDAYAFIRTVNDQDSNLAFGITLSDDLIGVVSVQPLPDVYHLTGELGYWIGESYWGKDMPHRQSN